MRGWTGQKLVSAAADLKRNGPVILNTRPDNEKDNRPTRYGAGRHSVHPRARDASAGTQSEQPPFPGGLPSCPPVPTRLLRRLISLDETAQLLWAAQGVTGLGGLRTAPSAGALYPLRTYLIAGNIAALAAGIYRYQPDSHTLKTVALGDRRDRLALAAMNQQCAREGALTVLFAANYFQSSREFGAAAPRLALLEAGHAAQNFCLQATCLDLGVITLGKFDADLLREALDLPAKEDPLYLVVAGRK